MQLQIQYCTTTDGVSIAYYTMGSGPPLIATVTSWESIQFDADDDFGGVFFRTLAEEFTVIRYDRRGTGFSDRDRTDFAIDADVRDLEAVVQATSLDRFALFGLFHLGPVAIAYAARHPAHVSHLILYGTYARGADLTRPDVRQSIVSMLRSHWGIASRTIIDMVAPGIGGERLDALARHTRSSATGDMAASLLEMGYEVDVLDLLPSIEAPTLVLHREHDHAAAFRHGRAIAAHIPGAKLVRLEGDVHFPWFGDSAAVVRAIEEFLPGGSRVHNVSTRKPEALRTILFTDIVGHTEMMQRLGDAKGRDVLREHERITRETLKAHAGSEVKTMGDGFMASFGSVTSAMECAIALQRSFAAHTESMPEPLHVRVGLNAGEPIEEDGDLFGATVILASRIAAKAGAGEILVPDTVRGLLSGKSFVFGDRGEFVPKGFDEAVRLWDVRWRE